MSYGPTNPGDEALEAPPSSPPPPPGDPLFDEPTGAAGPARTAAAAPNRRALVGAGLGAAVIALGAVIGINLASSGAESASTAASAMPSGMAGAQGGMPGGPGMAGGGGGGTVGTVDSVDGSTLTVSTQDGRSVSVTTSDDTVVAISEAGSADDVDEGDQVLVMGAADGDTIAAERVVDRGDTDAGDAASNSTGSNSAASNSTAGPPGGMGGLVTGEVGSVDGDTFTVSTADGAVTVTMTDSTTVVVEVHGSVSDLSSGDSVMVQGEAADDDGVTATRIISGDLPQGGPPMQGGSTGQTPAAPGGSSGSTGQPAGMPGAGGGPTT